MGLSLSVPSSLLCTSGGPGEVRLPAENGQPGEDVEEALVCPETGTNPVLQVSGETLPREEPQGHSPHPHCVRGWRKGRVASGLPGGGLGSLAGLGGAGPHRGLRGGHLFSKHAGQATKAVLGQLAGHFLFLPN